MPLSPPINLEKFSLPPVKSLSIIIKKKPYYKIVSIKGAELKKKLIII